MDAFRALFEQGGGARLPDQPFGSQTGHGWQHGITLPKAELAWLRFQRKHQLIPPRLPPLHPVPTLVAKQSTESKGQPEVEYDLSKPLLRAGNRGNPNTNNAAFSAHSVLPLTNPDATTRTRLQAVRNGQLVAGSSPQPFVCLWLRVPTVSGLRVPQPFRGHAVLFSVRLSLFDCASSSFVGRSWSSQPVPLNKFGALPEHGCAVYLPMQSLAQLAVAVEVVAHLQQRSLSCGWSVVPFPDLTLAEYRALTSSSSQKRGSFGLRSARPIRTVARSMEALPDGTFWVAGSTRSSAQADAGGAPVTPRGGSFSSSSRAGAPTEHQRTFLRDWPLYRGSPRALLFVQELRAAVARHGTLDDLNQTPALLNALDRIRGSIPFSPAVLQDMLSFCLPNKAQTSATPAPHSQWALATRSLPPATDAKWGGSGLDSGPLGPLRFLLTPRAPLPEHPPAPLSSSDTAPARDRVLPAVRGGKRRPGDLAGPVDPNVPRLFCEMCLFPGMRGLVHLVRPFEMVAGDDLVGGVPGVVPGFSEPLGGSDTFTTPLMKTPALTDHRRGFSYSGALTPALTSAINTVHVPATPRPARPVAADVQGQVSGFLPGEPLEWAQLDLPTVQLTVAQPCIRMPIGMVQGRVRAYRLRLAVHNGRCLVRPPVEVLLAASQHHETGRLQLSADSDVRMSGMRVALQRDVMCTLLCELEVDIESPSDRSVSSRVVAVCLRRLNSPHMTLSGEAFLPLMYGPMACGELCWMETTDDNNAPSNNNNNNNNNYNNNASRRETTALFSGVLHYVPSRPVLARRSSDPTSILRMTISTRGYTPSGLLLGRTRSDSQESRWSSATPVPAGMLLAPPTQSSPQIHPLQQGKQPPTLSMEGKSPLPANKQRADSQTDVSTRADVSAELHPSGLPRSPETRKSRVRETSDGVQINFGGFNANQPGSPAASPKHPDGQVSVQTPTSQSHAHPLQHTHQQHTQQHQQHRTQPYTQTDDSQYAVTRDQDLNPGWVQDHVNEDGGGGGVTQVLRSTSGSLVSHESRQSPPPLSSVQTLLSRELVQSHKTSRFEAHFLRFEPAQEPQQTSKTVDYFRLSLARRTPPSAVRLKVPGFFTYPPARSEAWPCLQMEGARYQALVPPHLHALFLVYLLQAQFTVEVWDAHACLPVGVACIPLRHLLTCKFDRDGDPMPVRLPMQAEVVDADGVFRGTLVATISRVPLAAEFLGERLAAQLPFLAQHGLRSVGHVAFGARAGMPPELPWLLSSPKLVSYMQRLVRKRAKRAHAHLCLLNGKCGQPALVKTSGTARSSHPMVSTRQLLMEPTDSNTASSGADWKSSAASSQAFLTAATAPAPEWKVGPLVEKKLPPFLLKQLQSGSDRPFDKREEDAFYSDSAQVKVRHGTGSSTRKGRPPVFRRPILSRDVRRAFLEQSREWQTVVSEVAAARRRKLAEIGVRVDDPHGVRMAQQHQKLSDDQDIKRLRQAAERIVHQRIESQRTALLEAVADRERAKLQHASQVLQTATKQTRVVLASFGGAYFWEVGLRNPFSHPIRVRLSLTERISEDQMRIPPLDSFTQLRETDFKRTGRSSVRLVTERREWAYLKDLHRMSTPFGVANFVPRQLEVDGLKPPTAVGGDGAIDIGDEVGADLPDVILGANQLVFIPLVYTCTERHATAQVCGFGDQLSHHKATARARLLSVNFHCQLGGAPSTLGEFRLLVVPTPPIVERTVHFDVPAESTVTRSLGDELRAQALRSDDPGVQLRMSVVGRDQGQSMPEVKFTCHAGAAGTSRRFHVAVYGDAHGWKLLRVFAVEIHAHTPAKLVTSCGRFSLGQLFVPAGSGSARAYHSGEAGVRLANGVVELKEREHVRVSFQHMSCEPMHRDVLITACHQMRRVHSWVLSVRCEPALVTAKPFRVSLPHNTTAVKSFEYHNPLAVPRRFFLHSSDPSVLQVTEPLLSVQAQDTVRVSVKITAPGQTRTAYLFFSDARGKTEETLEFVIE